MKSSPITGVNHRGFNLLLLLFVGLGMIVLASRELWLRLKPRPPPSTPLISSGWNEKRHGFNSA